MGRGWLDPSRGLVWEAAKFQICMGCQIRFGDDSQVETGSRLARGFFPSASFGNSDCLEIKIFACDHSNSTPKDGCRMPNTILQQYFTTIRNMNPQMHVGL